MGRAKPVIAQSGVGFRAVRPDAHKTYKSGGKLTKKHKVKSGKKSK